MGPNRRYLIPRRVTPRQIVDEGVIELGRIGSLLYVLTNAKLRLFHANEIPRLDSPNRHVPPDMVMSAIDVGGMEER